MLLIRTNWRDTTGLTGAVRLMCLGCGALLFAYTCGPDVRGCSTPVFRYALENWPADAYDILIHGNPGEKEGIEAEADEVLRPPGGKPANAYARFRADDVIAPGAARMEVRFPLQPQGIPPVWEGPYARSTLVELVDSAVRTRLVEELMHDATAVFLFLESGNEEADTQARKRLRGVLDELEKNLELPPPAEDAPAVDPTAVPVPVALRFPVIDIRRNDPAEAFLERLLLATESDLTTLKEPMTFPVFGRGRALYAIVGRGINREVLIEACVFITGACSCQVKAQNPGVDLLLRAGWDQIFDGMPYEEVELPPLTGVAPMIAPAEDVAEALAETTSIGAETLGGERLAADINAAATQQEKVRYGVSWFAAIAVAAIGCALLLLTVGTIWILVKSRE